MREKNKIVMKYTHLFIMALASFVFGCSPFSFLEESMDKMVPDDDEEFAKAYLATLVAHDYDAAIKQLDPQFVKPDVNEGLKYVADALSQGKPVSVELVGCNIFSNSEKRRSSMTYQYQFRDSWLLTTITIDSIGEKKQVYGVQVKSLPQSLKVINAFTFTGKTILHYIMLGLTIIIPLFILLALVLCIRTKAIKKKWLWILFILFGFGNLSFNWSTGQLLFNPLSINFQLMGAGAVKAGLYAPWILTISLPLGAMVFLARRRKHMNADVSAVTEESIPHNGIVLEE